jgi:hypothetical protein
MTQPALGGLRFGSVPRLHGAVTPQRGVPTYPEIYFENRPSLVGVDLAFTESQEQGGGREPENIRGQKGKQLPDRAGKFCRIAWRRPSVLCGSRLFSCVLARKSPAPKAWEQEKWPSRYLETDPGISAAKQS